MLLTGAIVLAVSFVTHPLFAGEVSYQETTKITGGSVMSMMKFASAFSKDARKLGQPVVTTVAVKGDRMARITQDYVDITDLNAKTITHIDKVKQEYSVVTFAQLKEAMQRAMERAQDERASASSQPSSNSQPTNSQPAKNDNVQLGFDAHVRKTGASKQVSGLDTNEIILTLALNGTDKTTGQQGALALTNDMWMAPEVPAYAEVREFEKRIALEMGSPLTGHVDFAPLFQQQPQSSEAFKTMAKEMSQLQGVPILQVMRMGVTANGQPLPAASEAPLAADNNGPSFGQAIGGQVVKTSEDVAQQTAAQEATQKIRGALGNSVGSAIGGFGGFGRKKKQPATQDTTAASGNSTQPTGGAQPQSAILMEAVTELGNFTQHVDPAMMEVPAGYKLVTAPELREN